MKKLKNISKLVAFIILFIAAEKFCKRQTCGFRVAKTRSVFPFNPAWEIDAAPPHHLLNQRFYFLGCGAQCYAFLGEDQTTVLKLFNQKRSAKAFSSSMIAYRQFPEETGLLHLNLNPKIDQYPRIELYDKIGVRHTVDLNNTPFLLQKKGELIFTYLEQHPAEIPTLIDSFLTCISKQARLGIGNSDRHIARNFGICEGQVIEIDTGSFLENGSIEKKDIERLTHELKLWVEKNHPELSLLLHEKIEKEFSNTVESIHER